MQTDYSEYQRVQECMTRRANGLLEQGWHLLAILSSSDSARHPTSPEGANAGAWYVRRGVLYVVGLPRGVEWTEPPRDSQ